MTLPAEIVDAHHHFWNPVTNNPAVGYVWLKDIGAPKPFGDPTPIQRDYLPEEFLAEASPCQITASVHVQADGAIADPVAETIFIDGLAEMHRHEMAIVGFVNLSSRSAEATIERHVNASKRFRGVRQIISHLADRPDLSFANREYLEDEGWCERFALLGKYGLSFDLQCYPEQMYQAAELISGHPDIPIIIDHAGSPRDQSDEGLARWRAGLARLSGLPQVSIKLSGFGMFDLHWNARTIAPIFETIEELFGRDRMMFASNFPVDKLMRGYDELLTDIDQLTSRWDEASRLAFFSGNARRVYRLGDDRL